MSNYLTSILQEETGNINKINLYLIDGYWKAYEVSARRLSDYLGDKFCQKEIFQGNKLDTLRITPEFFLEKNLVNYCSQLEDYKLILDIL